MSARREQADFDPRKSDTDAALLAAAQRSGLAGMDDQS